MDTVYIGSTNIVVLELQDYKDHNPINDAVITLGVLAADSAPLVKIADIVFTYRANSNGIYDGRVEDTVTLTEDKIYIVTGLITAGSDKKRFRKKVKAQYYKGEDL